MESITVTTEELRKSAERVDGIAKEYGEVYDALLNDIATFTSTDWKGDDADAFRNQVEGFRQDFYNMKNLMNEYANHLRQSAIDYEEAQRRITQGASSVTN